MKIGPNDALYLSYKICFEKFKSIEIIDVILGFRAKWAKVAPVG